MKICSCRCRVLAASALQLLLATAIFAQTRELRSSLDLSVPVAPVRVAMAGTAQLLYELHVTNFSADTITIVAARVLDQNGESLLDLSNSLLEQRIVRLDARSADAGQQLTLPAGMRSVLYLELSIDLASVPRELQHRIEISTKKNGKPIVDAVSGARVTLSEAHPVVLDAPLRGGPWVAIHDPSWTRGHRRMLFALDGNARIPGRYAMDFIRLDTEGRSARADADVVANWLGYGQAVLAVADGVVAAVRDDMTEVSSVAAHPRHALSDATGNYIALDIGKGRYAFYEHLKPGSVSVQVGQRVRSGAVIAALGFTGDSTGPHLHFHVADRNSPLGAEGVPFVFSRFELLGGFANLDHLGSSVWLPRAPTLAAQRKAERPRSNVVLQFPLPDR